MSAYSQTELNNRAARSKAEQWRGFLADEAGSELLEWLLLTLVLLMVGIPALMLVAEELNEILEMIVEELRRVVP